MSKIEPYVFFDGNCTEAMQFYERALGGKLVIMKVGGSPAEEHMPPGSADRVLHADLTLPTGGRLMASDDMVGADYKGKHGVSVALSYPTVDEARRAFDALAEGGTVTMPFDKTFFAEGFGMLTDRFGTAWMVTVEP